MHRRSSTGDLVPRDISEILALQSNKKKRGSSLGRAFSWLKGSKRRRSVSAGHSRIGEKTASANNIHCGDDATGQKQDEQRRLTVHYTSCQHYQKNVFIEENRPKFLEDLHTEAQEGLKIFQQEEHQNEIDFLDDQTVLEDDASSRERDGSLETDSTTRHSLISVSTSSAVSSRQVLTRQGSTFKPLNPVKRLDKCKKRRRTTIMGIPQQVQRELDMARSRMLLQQLPNEEQNGTDESDGPVVIPTIDGQPFSINHKGARVHLQKIEVLRRPREDDFIKNHINSVHQEDANRKFEAGLYHTPRPKSLAVPGMTNLSFLHEPQGPVMSISPQATYLSKIIPNAILPPGVDVIEINHDHSRFCASTNNKSNGTSGSPRSSQSGNGPHQGEPSTRSRSQSSETVMSNLAMISSKENVLLSFTPDSTKEVSDLTPKDTSVPISSCSKGTDQTPEEMLGCQEGNARNSCSFFRSLSVMKPKQPPEPPQRTHSLHKEKLKLQAQQRQNTKYVGDFKYKTEKEPVSSSLLNSLGNVQSSRKYSSSQIFEGTPQKEVLGENKLDRTLSPSSGYSSQSGTPTHSPKEVSPSSPEKRKIIPSKPERTVLQTSPLVSVSSSMTSLFSVTSDTSHHDTPLDPARVFITVAAVPNKQTPASQLIELFNIPPPPKVKAPSPPPPETWINNKHTFELLCGPGPNCNRLTKFLKEQTESSSETQKRNTEIIRLKESGPKSQEDEVPDLRPMHNFKMVNIQTQDQFQSQTLVSPPHQKLQTFEAYQSIKAQTICENDDNAETKKCSTKSNQAYSKNLQRTPGLEVALGNSMSPTFVPPSEHSPVQSPSPPPEHPQSPSPSPPPEHAPPPPPSKTPPTTSSDEEELEQKVKEDVKFPESPWPPPPPPMDESAGLNFNDQDELDFPPPPPSIIQEPLLEQSGKRHQEQLENIETIPSIDRVSLSGQYSPYPKQLQSGFNFEASNTPALPVDPVHKGSTSGVSPKSYFLPQNEVPTKIPSNSNVSDSSQAGTNHMVPTAPTEDQSAVSFQRRMSPTNKDNRNKELLCRNRSSLIPKEDANIPLVTPSLLQMVRLRAVSVSDDQAEHNHSNPKLATNENQGTINQTTPQKPIRKSLTVKSNPAMRSSVPSVRLQEAIRMKTATMSSSGATGNICFPPASISTNSPVLSPKTSDDSDLNKSLSTTASFIFSKAPKKAIIKTPKTQESEGSLKHNLVTEIQQVSDQSKLTFTNGTKKPGKMPPPVAKKPTNPPCKNGVRKESSTNDHNEFKVKEPNNPTHPAGQGAQALGSKDLARTGC